MKINFRPKITIAAVAVMSLLASCETVEETDFALNEKPIVSAAQTSFSVPEGETIQIPVTIDQPINQPLTFKLLIADGTTAENGADYEAGDGPQSTDWGFADAGFSVVVPAYAESFTIPFTAFEDLVPQEGSETVTLVLTASGVRNAVTPEGGITFDITVEEVESEDFVVQLAWDATYVDADGDSHSFCDFDLDLELYDNATGELLGASYSACPEELRIAPGDLPDGSYALVATYWSPAGAAVPVDFDAIPAMGILAQPGVSYQEVDLSALWTDFEAGYDEGNPNATVLIANLVINDGTYTITDAYVPPAPEEGEGEGEGEPAAYYSARTLNGRR